MSTYLRISAANNARTMKSDLYYVSPRTFVDLRRFPQILMYFEEICIEEEEVVAVDHRIGENAKLFVDYLKELWKGEPPSKREIQFLTSYDPFPMVQVSFRDDARCYFIPKWKAEELVKHQGAIMARRYSV
jgi:hypothetical protein